MRIRGDKGGEGDKRIIGHEDKSHEEEKKDYRKNNLRGGSRREVGDRRYQKGQIQGVSVEKGGRRRRHRMGEDKKREEC